MPVRFGRAVDDFDHDNRLVVSNLLHTKCAKPLVVIYDLCAGSIQVSRRPAIETINHHATDLRIGLRLNHRNSDLVRPHDDQLRHAHAIHGIN